jgi:predicted metal-binding protein
MEWTDQALQELEKAPGFVRNMARKAVENEIRKSGRDVVTIDDVKKARDKHIKFAEKKEEDKKKTRIAIVRCETVSEVCPGVACFKAFNARHAHFANYGDDVEIIGFFTCGGCPGRRVSRLVEALLKYDLDIVHLSSCMLLSGSYPRCPFVKQIKRSIEEKGITVVEGTHH